VAAGITAWTDIVSSGTPSNGALTMIGTQAAAMAVVQGWF
jgi:hypothetical protein